MPLHASYTPSGGATNSERRRPTTEVEHMLLKVSCVPCRLSTLWTDDPEGFLSDICNHPRRCEALLSDEDFSSLHSGSTVTESDPSHSERASY